MSAFSGYTCVMDEQTVLTPAMKLLKHVLRVSHLRSEFLHLLGTALFNGKCVTCFLHTVTPMFKEATTYSAVLPVGNCSHNYQCESGECISWSLYCDFKDDCSDGSDEFMCGKSIR